MKRFFFISCCVAASLAACDPVRRIDFRNHGRDTAEVIWKVKEDSIGFNPFNISNSRTLKLVVPPGRKTKVKMSFGEGTWSPTEVENLIKGVESFEIRSAHYQTLIDSLPVLKEFLLARRKGVSGSRIEIVVER